MELMSTPNSCDTMVALPAATAHGQVIFGKNSDRPADEAQPLLLRPRARHAGGSAGAQFVAVPQVAETYRHVGSRPYWCAGYEHGFNEHQVVIGNEALPTRLAPSRVPRLVGMELLRLGLERAATAAQAVEVITGLISRFGQGKFDNRAGVRTYDNAFIIADPREAYIVEAVGHDWAVHQVERSATISNVCALGARADRLSPGVQRQAREAGLWGADAADEFDFAAVFAERSASASGIARQGRSEALLRQHEGRVDVPTMMRILSDHGDGAQPAAPFVEDVAGPVSVCMHRTQGDERASSAASLVADLCATGERLAVYWCGLYSPCMTLYLPAFVEAELPAALAIGDAVMSESSPWWCFHRLSHAGLAGGAPARAAIRAAWRPLQQELLASAYEMAARGRELLDDGRAEAATDLLSGYMQENFTRMMTLALRLGRE